MLGIFYNLKKKLSKKLHNFKAHINIDSLDLFFKHLINFTLIFLLIKIIFLTLTNRNAIKECGQSKQEIRIVGEFFSLKIELLMLFQIYCTKGGRPTGINQYPWVAR